MFGGLFQRKPQGLGMFGGQPETYEAMGGMGAPPITGAQGFQMHNPTLAMMGLGMMSGRNNQEAFGNAMHGALAGHKMAQGNGVGTTDKIKNFMFAKRQGYEGTFQEWMRDEGTDSEYGLNPQFGRDKDGNPIMLQVGKDGTAITTKLPEGVKLDPGWLTHQRALGTAVGKAQGEAQVDYPGVVSKAEQFLGQIQDVRNDPNRERGTGKSSVFNAMPASKGFDFQQKVDQLKGKAFLEAYQSLKGGGQITEVEGMKAEAAISRLNTAQSEEAFVEALGDLEDVVRVGVERARTRAGIAPQQGEQPQGEPKKRLRYNPATGDFE